MVNTSMLSRQPTQLDYADSTKFVLKLIASFSEIFCCN